MKKNEVKIGATYTAKVSGKVVRVRIDAENRHDGWNGTNLRTGKKVRIKSAQRLRAAAGKPLTKSVKGKQAKEKKPVDPNRSACASHADRCATPRCKGEPTVTHLGKPLCQKCWDRVCQAESDMEAVARMAAAKDETAPADGATTQTHACAPTAPANQEENDMASKKNKKSKKARKSSAKEKATAKAKTPAKPKAAGQQKEKRLSAIDAAAKVLKKAGKPMHSREMIAAMAEQGLWSSPNGKTPAATLYSAMLREIQKSLDSGGQTISRFRKVERGQFAFNAAAK